MDERQALPDRDSADVLQMTSTEGSPENRERSVFRESDPMLYPVDLLTVIRQPTDAMKKWRGPNRGNVPGKMQKNQPGG
jgi:hypothetical protein